MITPGKPGLCGAGHPHIGRSADPGTCGRAGDAGGTIYLGGAVQPSGFAIEGRQVGRAGGSGG